MTVRASANGNKKRKKPLQRHAGNDHHYAPILYRLVPNCSLIEFFSNQAAVSSSKASATVSKIGSTGNAITRPATAVQAKRANAVKLKPRRRAASSMYSICSLFSNRMSLSRPVPFGFLAEIFLLLLMVLHYIIIME